MKLEIWKAESDSFWYWHMKNRNGKIVWDGESHRQRGNVIRAAKRCNSLLKKPVKIFLNGKLYFDPAA